MQWRHLNYLQQIMWCTAHTHKKSALTFAFMVSELHFSTQNFSPDTPAINTIRSLICLNQAKLSYLLQCILIPSPVLAKHKKLPLTRTYVLHLPTYLYTRCCCLPNDNIPIIIRSIYWYNIGWYIEKICLKMFSTQFYFHNKTSFTHMWVYYNQQQKYVAFSRIACAASAVCCFDVHLLRLGCSWPNVNGIHQNKKCGDSREWKCCDFFIILRETNSVVILLDSAAFPDFSYFVTCFLFMSFMKLVANGAVHYTHTWNVWLGIHNLNTLEQFVGATPIPCGFDLRFQINLHTS